MKFSSLKLTHAAFAGALALLLSGCPKKPDRPDPASTMLGQQGASTATNLGGGAAPVNLTTDGLSGLVQRPEGFDPIGQNRTALEAQTVYFDFDKSDVKAAERPKLQTAKEYLEKNPTFRLLLEGHCDWRGTAEYNLGLGDRRANAVKKYLQSLGLPADRLETLSKGSLEASKNASEATMAKDRRVNLVVIDPALAAPKPL